MRRLLLVVIVAVMALPVAPALATELDELLERTRSAEYSAEQFISCQTPEGVQDAVVEISQSRGDITIASNSNDVEISAGAGLWTLSRADGAVTDTAVDGARNFEAELYEVDDAEQVTFLGRSAQSYRLERDGVLRAELVVDDETGALVRAVTFTANGDVYCSRRFVSIDTDAPAVTEKRSIDPVAVDQVEDSMLPPEVAGFERLDHYEDADGFRFAYYSDGFFSFALFETPALVDLPGATEVELEAGVYRRAFDPGQATYVWVTEDGGMALIGDLPPDLHETVLAAMPSPQDDGFLRRWWRALFG